MKLLVLLFIFISCSVNAAVLECTGLVNLDIVSKVKLETSVNIKILIDKTQKFTSYVTELRPDVFSVEVFLPDLEIRIYSEGALSKLNDSLTATAWSREVLVDVVCKKTK